MSALLRTRLLLKKWKYQVDWKLLIFLVLFLDVKLVVKLIAIIVALAIDRNFRFGFRLKNSRLPLFYPAVIVLAILNWTVTQGYASVNYSVVVLTASTFWILCILASHQVKRSVETGTIATLHRTLLVFFLLNSLVSFLNLAAIIAETHALNPYQYQGNYQKYFIGTGDYIKGITFDICTTNAVISAFGTIYFLTRTQTAPALTCMVTLLLTGSNLMNLLVLVILGILFLFKSTRNQKSVIVVCVLFLVVFMVKVSPQNNAYAATFIQHVLLKNKKALPAAEPLAKPDDTLLPGTEAYREQVATAALDSIGRLDMANNPVPPMEVPLAPTLVIPASENGRINLPKDNIHTATFQSHKETPPEQRPLVLFVHAHQESLPFSGNHAILPKWPGKLIAISQTVRHFQQHPGRILLGEGAGNFSSKLAFRATSLGFAGGYADRFRYIHPAFLQNHLDLYLNYFSKSPGFHSLTNSPFSVYDQLLSEYGLLGLAALLFCYFGFFAKHYRQLTYGLPLLLLTAMLFLTEYWFEQLSVLVLFELLLYLDIRETCVNPVVHAR